MVTDNEILDAYHRRARSEGIFGEPAAATSVAGLLKYSRDDPTLRDRRVVCVITGTGLKDPDIATQGAEPWSELPADMESVERALGWR